ncbi:MAG: HepT-like ribonuclease domain-containing protein, partial [Coriobacteriia bacterium]
RSRRFAIPTADATFSKPLVWCMRPDDADLGYVWDMLQAAREVASFTSGHSFESWSTEILRMRAVERSIQNLGEAANHVTPEFRKAHGRIPWKEITAQRHVLVHDYGEIDPRRIWLVAIRDIPQVIPELESILGPGGATV